MEWFVPLFKNNFYDKKFDYFKLPGIHEDINENITEMYHMMKPTMKELFGYEFYDKLYDFFKTQKSQHGYKYDKYDDIPEEFKSCLRNSSHCGAYSSFEGSPMSKGIFQYDMWGVTPSLGYDWDALRKSVGLWCEKFPLCCAYANRIDKSNFGK